MNMFYNIISFTYFSQKLCRIWHGISNINSGRCLQLWNSLIGDFHREKADRRTIQRKYESSPFCQNRILPERVMEILEKSSLRLESQRLEEAGPSNLRSEQTECLVSILELGVACSAESPQDRRSMEQVYRELRMIKEKFIKAGLNEIN
ncbi:receptor kinase At3g47110 [Olea europaea subsp. europaea]|uniref:Receptor kinase At3g47110 n=1 Tax=Olea europaea subsp. europaea TaxID=158383 RepID=A0A8S0P6N1_OLEEU|nr:receptor kinase At3g47110 [Olea europaea subsp. europaea]